MRKSLIAFFAIASVAFCAQLNAAVMHYGNLASPNVMYLDITESSGTDPVPLYDEPSIAGDSLKFLKANLVALSTGGGFELTDGRLSFSLMAVPGVSLDAINLMEAGDYRLLGLGTNQTYVNVTALANIAITEVDGALLANPLVLNPTFSVTKTLPIDGGPAPGMGGDLKPWVGGFTVNLKQALLDNNIPFQDGVTKLHYIMDNQVLAKSEADSLAFIAKKQVMFTLTTEGQPDPDGGIPEPATVTLTLVSMIGLMFVRRRKA